MEADIIQRSNECRIPEMKTAKYFDVIKTHVSSWECPPIHYSRTCVPVFIHSTHECLGVKCPYSQICVTAYGSHGNNVLPIFFAWCTFSKYAYAICPFKRPGKLVQTMLQPYLIASQFNQILQHEANPWRQFLVGRVQLNARKVLIHPGLQKTHKTEFLFRHGNWKKCLGSTEPKQLGQGPPRPWWGAGAMPCWRVQGGKAPPPSSQLKTNFGILETSLLPLRARKFIFYTPWSIRTNISLLLYHTNQFLKLPTYIIKQPRSQNSLISFGTLKNQHVHEPIRAEKTFFHHKLLTL